MSIITFAVAAAPIASEIAEAQEKLNRKMRQEKRDAERRREAAERAAAEADRQIRKRRLPLERTPQALAAQPADFRVSSPGTKLATSEPIDGRGTVLQQLDVPRTDIAPGAGLSQDGRWLYLLRQGGRLQKVNLPKGFVVEREVVIPGGSHLALAQPGLVVACKGRGELVLLDPSSLQPREKIRLAGCGAIAGSPRSALVYAMWDHGFTLRAVDLAQKSLVADLDAQQVTAALQQENAAAVREPVNFSQFRLSPDGRRLLARCGSSHYAFQMRGGKLQWEVSRISNSTARAAWAMDLAFDPKKAWDDARSGDPATGEHYNFDPSSITLGTPDGYRGAEILAAPPIDSLRVLYDAQHPAAIRPTGRGLLVSSSTNLVWVERTPANAARGKGPK